MATKQKIQFFLLILINLTSCVPIDVSVKTMSIEVCKPGILKIPEDIHSVAIFKRDISKSDTCVLKYWNQSRFKYDTSIKYSDLSNKCVDGLANFLEENEYFEKVHNYRDSVNDLLTGSHRIENPNNFYEADMCIFLDSFQLSNKVPKGYGLFAFISKASLQWRYSFKNDSKIYSYNGGDTLYFNQEQYRNFRLQNRKSRQEYLNASEYLGRSFGALMIPNWVQVERLYYHSRNREMIQAEKLAMDQEWLKAAEIWNIQSKSRNKKIAAKASFNMALACEMDGKPELGFGWLERSDSIYWSKQNEDHNVICSEYMNILVLRNKEIKRFEEYNLHRIIQ